MKWKVLKWSLAALILGGLVLSYLTVKPVRRLVDKAAEAVGFGGVQEDQTYWCPMHPEITRKSPGTCPV